MARLINDSGVLGDSVKVTANTVKDVPFDKVIEAIHKVQQNIGITGTTSKEAASTIEGSTASVKAAWDNLMIGIADPKNQNIGQLISNFADSLITAMKNSLPRIREIVKGMSEAVKEIWNEVVPELKVQVPELKPVIDKLQWLKDNAPLIASAITGIVTAIGMFKAVSGIITVIGAFKKMHDAIMLAKAGQTALNLTMMANPIGLIVGAIAGLVAGFITLWNTSESFRNFWTGLWDGIKSVTSTVVNAIGGFFTNTLPNAIKTMLEFVALIPIKYWEFLGTTIIKVAEFGATIGQKALELGSQFLSNIISFVSQLPSRIWSFLTNVISRVASFGSSIGSKALSIGSQFLRNIVNNIAQLPSRIWSVLSNAIGKVASFASNIASKGATAARGLATNIINGIRHLPSSMMNWGKDMIQGLVNGIKSMIGHVGNAVKSVANKIKSFLHFSRPDEGPLREYEEWMPDMVNGLSASLEKASPSLINQTKALAKGMSDSLKIDGTVKGNINGVGGVSFSSDLVGAFKQALSEMKIEMDGDEMGKFVDRTVTRLVYA